MRFISKGLALTSAVALLATPVLAETDWGLSLGLSYFENTDTNNSVNALTGQMSYSYDSFGMQLDLVSNEYSTESTRRSNIGLHAYYKASPAWTIGAYYGRQDWFGADWDYYGVEAQYEAEMVEVEGYVGKFEPAGGSGFTQFGLDARYLVWDGGFDGTGPFSSGPSSSFGGRYYLTGGLHGVRDGIDETLIYLGGSAELAQGLFVDLQVARVADQNQFGLMLRKDFDGGVPFNPRGWTSAFKAW